ncbi:hypothetical protein EJF36_06635 [Bacillus sp. HMF5848]|uniref:hypothetical protein n=1 Tax=Bacillus sp. HMF5848 TaxID=2495421 RepID=UPI000F79F507|nr:hypothetical protein [Bacillus sp. HMF5848]RSK26562.1 hypothetical protein EJF36_06635 [Bacillus sp. HMF5848]
MHKIELITVDGLREDNLRIYENDGLRKLIQYTSRIIYNMQKKNEKCIVNASGGDNIETAFIGIICHVLRVPVFYQLDESRKVMRLPAFPVSLDYNLWLKHFSLFDRLYRQGFLSTNLNQFSKDQLLELKDFVEVHDDQYRLTSIGLLIHEASLHRFEEEGHVFLPAVSSSSSNEGIELNKEIPLAFKTDLEAILNLDYVQARKYFKL